MEISEVRKCYYLYTTVIYMLLFIYVTIINIFDFFKKQYLILNTVAHSLKMLQVWDDIKLYTQY